MAAQKQYANPLSIGDTVRITGEEDRGQVLEIEVTEIGGVENNHYGVYLDSIEKVEFFQADELEKVEPEQESAICESCGGLGQIREYPTGLFSLPAWKWVSCPECSVELPF